MSDEQKALIAYRLECLDEMMNDVHALVAEERWKSAVNRLYYAIFHIVSAL